MGRREAEKEKTLPRKRGRGYPGWVGHREEDGGSRSPGEAGERSARVHFGSQAPWWFLQLASEMR